MIDDLLSSNRIEPLEPRLDDAETAWREVTRRRRARTLRSQALAGVALVAVVMVGLLPSLDDGGRVADLDVADRNGGPRTHFAPRADEDADSEDLVDSDDIDSSPNSAGRRAPDAPPGKSVDAPVAQPARPGADQAPTPGRAKPAVERSRYGSVPIGCLDFCLYARAEPTGDGQFTLGLDLCVAVGGRARRFSYETTQEVDYWIAPSGARTEALWTWSIDQRFPPDAHSIDIAPSECMRWTVDWDATDESGNEIPPGQYRLSAKSLAEQAAQSPVTETTFQISE